MGDVFWLSLVILFGGLLLGLILGLPVAFTLGGAAILGAFIFMGPSSVMLVVFGTYSMMISATLIALPLFIFMAAILETSGVAEALYATMHQWLGSVRGGLAMGTVLICTLIAAMSGVIAAGVVTMGLIALPIMLKKGYSKSMALGPIMAGGCLGVLIPPSVTFVIFGMLCRTSIGRLFAGGLIPGLILSFIYVSYIGIRCYFQPHLGPVLPKSERYSFKQKLILSKGLILPVLLVMVVLGSIFAGIASPTEAASLGATGAVICAAVHRRLTWQLLKKSIYRTAQINGMIMWILFGAMCFATVFVSTGGPKLVEGFICGLEVEPVVVILFMVLTYFIMGFMIDELTMLFVTFPIYFPIVLHLGYDPVWFGVIYLVSCQSAYMTPPFGWALFYMKGIAPPEVTIADIYRSVIAFIPLQLIVLLLVIFFPQLALWLPSVVFGLR